MLWLNIINIVFKRPQPIHFLQDFNFAFGTSPEYYEWQKMLEKANSNNVLIWQVHVFNFNCFFLILKKGGFYGWCFFGGGSFTVNFTIALSDIEKCLINRMLFFLTKHIMCIEYLIIKSVFKQIALSEYHSVIWRCNLVILMSIG